MPDQKNVTASSRDLHLARMNVIRGLRSWLDEHGFQELICPILSPAVPAEPTIYPFVTHWNRQFDHEINSTPLFLPLSPERAMKHFLTLGFAECYSIGHCCRNMEAKGNTHHPEFLMLEWYRRDHDYRAIMDDTKTLLLYSQQKINHSSILEFQGARYDLTHWQTLSVDTLWQEKLGVPLQKCLELDTITTLASDRGYNVAGATWEQLFNQLFLNEIEPHFPAEPFFLIDFPAQLSPLCRPRADKPWLAERFEVYIHRLELGNGNSEQLDSNRVRELFAAELAERERNHELAPPLDEGMLSDIATLQHSGHTYAGIGLGVDRVAMLLSNVNSLGVWWPDFNTINKKS